MKIRLLVFSLLGMVQYAFGQQGKESLTIGWPPQYLWQIVQHQNDSNKQVLTIIPGNETVKTATIIGNSVVYKGLTRPNVDELLNSYQNNLGAGTKFTLISRHDQAGKLWALFKLETPKMPQYPDAESDLYYVVQGKYGLYEVHVAIKSPHLNASFVDQWSRIFLAGKLELH
ncbi:MAG: hypothetical protein Q8943_09595 [Bacteroidota bacterium]|nr:hypothetical protein [Bacteroidota bacterium]